MGGVRCLGKSPKKRFYIWFVKRIFARNRYNTIHNTMSMSNHSPTERKPFVWFFLIFLSVISVKYLQVTKLRCYCYKWERRILSCFDGLVLNPPSSLGILLYSIKNVVCIFYLVLYLPYQNVVCSISRWPNCLFIQQYWAVTCNDSGKMF